MKKVLRFVLILLLLVVAFVLVLALVEPKRVTVTRSIVINGSKEAVMDQITKFKNWPNWSPWIQQEPTVKLTYEGTDGQPGSSYHWVGDKTGTGTMRNTGVGDNKIDFKIEFEKPMKGEAVGSLVVTDTAGMEKVTWTFTSESPFPMNAFHFFFDMDKMIGGDFDRGLNSMKQYVESHGGAQATAEVKETDFAAHLYCAMRSTVAMADMEKVWKEQAPILGKALGAKITGPATGLYYTWDTVARKSDMAVAFPVSDSTVKVKGATYVAVPAGKALMAVLNGGYSGEMSVHYALHNKLAASGRQMSVAIEEYVNGPSGTPDSTKWVTNIYYLMK